MSMENAGAFYKKVKGDRELQQKIGELAKENPTGIETIIIKVAEENGFQFTLEEMRAFINELAAAEPKSGELNDAELEAVAGGNKLDTIEGTIALSAVTLGIGCIVSAANNDKFNCW